MTLLYVKFLSDSVNSEMFLVTSDLNVILQNSLHFTESTLSFKANDDPCIQFLIQNVQQKMRNSSIFYCMFLLAKKRFLRPSKTFMMLRVCLKQ